MRTELKINFQDENNDKSLEEKMEEFKKDPEKMKELNHFVDDVLINAQNEADKKLDAKKNEKMIRGRHSLINGLKRGRIITRARSAVVRLFEAICNCTTTTAPQIPTPKATE